MMALLIAALLLGGALFILLAAIGIVRMPDVFMRMQVATKASTLGAGLMMVGVAVYFADQAITTRSLLIIAFLMLTAPISAHMLGRAAYLTGVPRWEGTRYDELRDAYDPLTHRLDSREGPCE